MYSREDLLLFAILQQERKEFFYCFQASLSEKQREFFLLEKQEEIKRMIETCYKHNIQMFFYGEEGYPKHLYQISKPPYVLFVQGKLISEEYYPKAVALVGTRNCTITGENFTKEAGKYLREKGYYNISGLARGIDTIGHQETIGHTGAILGQGLLSGIYPRGNMYLAEEILEAGGFLLSELPPYETVSSFSLLRRNRLQTALTSTVLIAETGVKGGTVQTFRYAKAQKKEIFVASFNKEFLEKYEKDVSIIESIEELEEKRRKKWAQQSLFQEKN